MSHLETVEGLMSGVFDWCGNPSEDDLSPSQVLQAIYDRLQHHKNEMHLTDEGWDLDKLVVTVQPNKEQYLIVESDFGRPFFVETFENGKPLFRRREIEMARVQDRNLYTEVSTTNNGSNSAPFKHNATVFLFGNIGGIDPFFQVLPVPRQTAQYRIWHERIIGEEPALTSVPDFLRQFFPMLKRGATLDCLPLCNWPKEKFDQLWKAHSVAYAEYKDTFTQYIQQLFHEDAGDFRASNSSRRGGRRR